MQGMKFKYYHFVAVFLLGLSLLAAGSAKASPAKFNIPGDFPGDFRIDFLGTDFKLGGYSSGSLSTTSTVDFSVGSETSAGSGIYNISVDSQGFNFLGFQATSVMKFDVYGAGVGTGTFNTNTGDWELNVPTLFVDYDVDSSGDVISGNGVRIDFQLTTSNIWIEGNDYNPGYWATTASPMILDEASPEPWGDMNLVAGGTVPFASDLTLTYDWDLINSIASGYTSWQIDQDIYAGEQYEFNIYGNDPLVSSVPVPTAIWLFSSGLIGLFGFSRRRNHA